MSGLPKSFQYDPERDQVCILAEHFECTLELREKKEKMKLPSSWPSSSNSSKELSYQTSHLSILNFKEPHLNNPGPQVHVISLKRWDIEKEIVPKENKC